MNIQSKRIDKVILQSPFSIPKLLETADVQHIDMHAY